jgi:hypothetical protein
MTKLDDEIGSLKKNVTGAGRFVKDNIEMSAPRWLTNLFNNILTSQATPWFLIGMSVEALGLTVQFMFAGAAYPILDFVVGAGFGFALLYYQERLYDEEGEEEEKNP